MSAPSPAVAAPRSKPKTPTTQQRLAAEPGRNVWVSANAGTGKTRVLVDRIARLLLAGTRPEKILCLTFTKTGAAEMAARINAQLGRWAVMDEAALSEDLRALTGTAPDPATIQTAAKLFARVLDVPGGLKIRTIHAFCESLIARFPIEAGVAPHFAVIDERTTAEYLIEARERILQATTTAPDGALAGALNHLAQLVNEDGFAKLMQGLTGKRARLQSVLSHLRREGSLDQALARHVGLSDDEDSAASIIADAVRPETLDDVAMTRAAKALAQGSKTSKQNAEKLQAFLARDQQSRRQTFDKDYKTLFVTQDGSPASLERTMTSKDARLADPALESIMVAEQARVLAVLEKLAARATVDATASLLRVGEAMLEEYAHIKRVRARLDYDDLIEHAQTLLSTHDGGVSWVHYKLDGGIDHILVDESQDTSPQQWDVVKNLAEEFYAGIGRHEDRSDMPRTVFAVGDEKQSIYSFQGADPHEFGRMRDHFARRMHEAEQDLTSVELVISFRSTQAVLNAVNRVFTQPQAKDGLTFTDAWADHKSNRTGEAGLVEVWPVIIAPEKDKDDPWDAPVDYHGEASPDLRLAERIADTIQGWLTTGEKLAAHDRAIEPGDILILVRERKTFAGAMVRALKKRAIAVAGADRMVLTDQMAVMDLLAAGRFAMLPEDDLSLAELLKSPLVGFDEDALFDLAHDRPLNLWAALKARRDEREDFTRAQAYLGDLLAAADTRPPFEFYAELLRSGGRQAFLQRLGADAEDPIDEFLGAALEYERDHTPSLQGFLHWVMASSQTIKRDMETTANAVRVMTVHGAKGLEAPVVFLTDTCTAPDKKKASLLQWSADDNAPTLLWSPYKEARCQAYNERLEAESLDRDREYRRLLYVAMTRAADRLYVTGFQTGAKRKDGCWYDLIQPIVEDIGTSFQTTDGETGWRYETAQTAPVKDAPPTDVAGPILPAPAWLNAPAPTESTPSNPLQPSRPAVDEPPAYGPFDAQDDRRFKRGLLVHTLLETLPALAAPERRALGATWLAQPAHDLPPEAQALILNETLSVLENPAFVDLFGPDSLAEVAISGVLGEHVVSARLDRLAVTPDEVTVIDYKTNRPAPTRVQDVPEPYLRQMALYRALLAKIYPKHRIRPVLLWTDGPHIMALDDDILRAYAP